MPRKIGPKRISASQKAFDFCISRGTVFQVGKRKTRTLSKSLTTSHFNLTVRKAITNDMNIPTLVQVKGKEVKIHYDSEVSCEVRNLLIQRLREGVSLGKASKKTWIFYGQPDRKGGGGSATSALTVSKCENLDPFFQWNMTL